MEAMQHEQVLINKLNEYQIGYSINRAKSTDSVYFLTDIVAERFMHEDKILDICVTIRLSNHSKFGKLSNSRSSTKTKKELNVKVSGKEYERRVEALMKALMAQKEKSASIKPQ